jgi:deazaflavin-dependent oxidoreductase (nitroreductase family)
MINEPEYAPSPTGYVREAVELYEGSGGTEGTLRHGTPTVILTTTGAKSGKLRKTPLMRVEHDGVYAVVASYGGSPQHPAWYHNLVAHPDVELQDGPVRGKYQARELSGAEKAEWWQRALEVWPDYANYQTRTAREIPVFAIEPY